MTRSRSIEASSGAAGADCTELIDGDGDGAHRAFRRAMSSILAKAFDEQPVSVALHPSSEHAPAAEREAPSLIVSVLSVMRSQASGEQRAERGRRECGGDFDVSLTFS